MASTLINLSEKIRGKNTDFLWNSRLKSAELRNIVCRGRETLIKAHLTGVLFVTESTNNYTKPLVQ